MVTEREHSKTDVVAFALLQLSQLHTSMDEMPKNIVLEQQRKKMTVYPFYENKIQHSS